MSRLYYDCPVDYVYMQNKFNVRGILSGRYGSELFRVSLLTTGDIDWHFSKEKHKYYVHPSSYRIFEPKEGDMVYTKRPGKVGNVYATVDALHHDSLTAISPVGEIIVVYKDEVKTIQRDNKAFIMPKEE